MGTEHPRYKEEFRKHAKPVPMPWPASWTTKGRPAAHASVLVSALLAASATLGLWSGTGALALIYTGSDGRRPSHSLSSSGAPIFSGRRS